jgi:phosphatidylserine/phosphatidylglycerophosphate/cardiolipin synthase-like enzyme
MSTPEEDGRSATGEFVPEAVWTGSFNFSVNAGRSLENAVFIEDTAIAQAYANEFSQVAALSEPLNWQDPWCSPEWRCGT